MDQELALHSSLKDLAWSHYRRDGGIYLGHEVAWGLGSKATISPNAPLVG